MVRLQVAALGLCSNAAGVLAPVVAQALGYSTAALEPCRRAWDCLGGQAA